MTAFDDCRGVEFESWRMLQPHFQLEWSDDGHYAVITKGRLAKELQAKYGDVILNFHGEVKAIEIKSERRYTGNLFLESWSNYPHKPGWMHTLDADYIFYHFIDRNILYIIDFPALKEWAFDWKFLEIYPEKPQGKYTQLNDTRGYIVPISELMRDMKPGKMKEIELGVFQFGTCMEA